MDLRQLTEKAIEHEARIAAHDEELKTLFNQQKNIEKLADSTRELAQSVKGLAVRVDGVDERLGTIEGEERKKTFAVWQIIVSALFGGALTYIVTLALGG